MSRKLKESNGKIIERNLKDFSGEFSLETIRTISFSKQDVNDITILSKCSGLESLDLSFNDLYRLHPLSQLVSLVRLNISGNKLTSLDPLRSCISLEFINASGNLIGSLPNISPLAEIDNLHELCLKDESNKLENPICHLDSYKEEICRILPQITILDNMHIKGPESKFFDICNELDKMIKDSSKVEISVPLIQSHGDKFDLDSTYMNDSVLNCPERAELEKVLEECRLQIKNSLNQ